MDKQNNIPKGSARALFQNDDLPAAYDHRSLEEILSCEFPIAHQEFIGYCIRDYSWDEPSLPHGRRNERTRN